MINKISFIILFLLVFISGYSQNEKTGIGTVNPQQALHVAGTSTSVDTAITGVKLVKPTIRIEGLNSTNNSAHLAADGTSSLKRVYANQSGDLLLINGTLEQPVIAQQFGDAIPTNELIGTGGGTFQNTVLKSQTFTLTQESVVYFSASFAALLRETVSGSPVTINDGRAKLYGAYYQFSAAPAGVSTTATFGNNKQTYANVSNGVAGNFFLSPRAELVLPAGTYTVNLYGELFSSVAGNRFRVQFAGTTTAENFLINASPTKY
nr:hypothetical protein [uncultured Flavobacterium sp.]